METAVWVGVVVCTLYAPGESSVCDGIWKIDKIENCENDDKYPIALDIIKRKIERNKDGYSGKMEFPENFGKEYGVRMESYEKCDGGYKASDVIVGGACDMFNQFVKENFQELLGLAGVESRDCPIPKGKYEIKNYVINYEDLPQQGKCGDYKWNIFLTKYGQKQGCICVYTTFTAKEENDEEEEDG